MYAVLKNNPNSWRAIKDESVATPDEDVVYTQPDPYIPSPPPITEVVYNVPVYATDFIVSSPKINSDPELALLEAIAEMEKGDGNPKSIALISLSLAKYLKSKKDKLK